MLENLKDKSRYEKRGVSSGKSEVHAAIEKLDKGLRPGAFCKISPDILGGDAEFCNIQHADGAGTKSSLAYLVWKTSGDLKVWKGIVRDSLFMNLDDIGCVGSLGPFLISMTIGRNKALIPGEIIKILIETCHEVCQQMSELGILCHLTGGETADVGDLVRTIVVDNTVVTRFHLNKVINAGRIIYPALIVGFSSTGQTIWETEPNAGMGSNGLTNARHDVLSPLYRQFTETFCPQIEKNLTYSGKYRLDDELPGDSRFTIGSALLSPTRTYLPLIKRIIDELGTERIMGLIHCSGGGQTKIGKFGQPGIKYRKDNLFPTPPLFQMLQEVRHLPPKEMFQSYNMGHRLEAVVESQQVADRCITIAKNCGIEARVIGEVVPFDNPHGRQVEIITKRATLQYDFIV